MKKVIRMKRKAILLLSITGIWAMAGFAQTTKDSTRIAGSLTIDEVVVTGTRNETDIRHLPMTISVVNCKVLEQSFQPSVLPVLTEQVPGLFTTSRGIMGYGAFHCTHSRRIIIIRSEAPATSLQSNTCYQCLAEFS